jgi:hypothetical protein
MYSFYLKINCICGRPHPGPASSTTYITWRARQTVCEHAAHQDETEMAAWLGPLAQQQGRVQARHGRRQHHPPGYDVRPLPTASSCSASPRRYCREEVMRTADRRAWTDWRARTGRRAPVNLPYSNCIFNKGGDVFCRHDLNSRALPCCRALGKSITTGVHIKWIFFFANFKGGVWSLVCGIFFKGRNLRRS